MTLREVEKQARELQRQNELKAKFAGYRLVSLREWVSNRMRDVAKKALDQ